VGRVVFCTKYTYIPVNKRTAKDEFPERGRAEENRYIYMGCKMFEVKNIHDTLCYVTDMCSKESEGGWVSVTDCERLRG